MRNTVFHLSFALLVVISSMMHGCSKGTEPNSDQETNGYTLSQDVEWSSPNGHSLTMDIYVPKTGQAQYPVLIIFHGGGWTYNDKSPMTSMSEYVAGHAEYAVCNVNYRLLVDDGNTITMNQIIEDAMGAVLWVRANIAPYRGDPTRLIVTGDSAGGHLAAMVVLCGTKLESDGFAGPSLGFNPTFLPEGKTAEDIAVDKGLEVQAGIFSYAVYEITTDIVPWGIFGPGINPLEHPEYYEAVSPIDNIPRSVDRRLPPMLCTAGSLDFLITPASVQNFIENLKRNGHGAEYWEHEGRGHAYLDGGDAFERDAIPALDRMIEFMDEVFAE